jgi:hypothetical protein
MHFPEVLESLNSTAWISDVGTCPFPGKKKSFYQKISQKPYDIKQLRRTFEMMPEFKTPQ